MKWPDSWVDARIGDVLRRVDSRVDPQTSDSLSHFYVGLEHIESRTGRLLRDATDETDSSDILSVKTAFQRGDILYGKLRPALNKVHLAQQDGICSTDIWVFRVTRNILPEFALLYLRSSAIHIQASQLAAGANLPRVSARAFDRLSIHLPHLLEQQRIVAILQQAESAATIHKSRREQLDLMIKSDLDRLVLAVDLSDWTPLRDLVETRYGTSVSADSTVDAGVPVLRIPNVMGGEVDTTDLKYVSLSKVELNRLQLTNSDVLIVRSNGNPEYVGRSAPITDDVAGASMIYASYLIRLRSDKNRLLPEYLSSFLNSAYGKAAMRNAIRTTAGQSNLSGGNLDKVKIPLPHIADQQRFRKFWLEVRALRQCIAKAEHAALALQSALNVDAMSGELTEDWRTQNHEQIAAAVLTRDELLRQSGAKLTSRAPEPAPTTPRPTAPHRPARQWLIDELSDFQREVLTAFSAYPDQPLLAEDADVFTRFCDEPDVAARLAAFDASPNHIRRTLSQLAALGLIAKLTLPKLNPATGERGYLKAFRPLRGDENTQAADVTAMRRALDGLEAGSAAEGSA